ncbi:MAG TPA: 3-oxoacyl-ACP reductase FabG [Flavobacteriaceae bacterium]|nr:3-oxoacyl-ACP reductase FabG [Flavobacteriaceae bacterium]HIB47676.1 3-oxoacyl-ACP reductase FabG [Flavobacteriaceae bacterium]HIN99438.1 3-oxoacyl-ACP reductase FabG [Flavobacteriaceae bacterium]
MKVALVTGGSRGIGRAISIQLAADHGYHVLINFRGNKTAAKETLTIIENDGGTVELLPFDVGNADETQKALASWQKSNPEAVVEVIVNNAGITKDGLFVWMKPDDWKTVLDTSLNGFFNVTQAFLQPMLLQRYGRIINIVSLSGLKGTAGQVNYAAAKGAIVAATKSLAQEVAKRNVTVNAVAPGFISTDMTADLDEAELKKLVPLNRFGTADEVAHLVSFLSSKKAAYITGEVININGGIYS